MLQKTKTNPITAKFDYKNILRKSLLVGTLNFLMGIYLFVISPFYSSGINYGYINRPSFFSLMVIDPWTVVYYKIVILFIGTLFAFAAFNLVSNKKANNFYFANGLTRNAYYFNRIKASVTVMLFSTLIPVIIDVAINIRYFGYAGIVLQYGFLIYLEYISILLIGFAVATACSVITYTRGIAIITTGAVIAAPTVFTGVAVKCMTAFLRGFVINYNIITKLNMYTGCFVYNEPEYYYHPYTMGYSDVFSFVSNANMGNETLVKYKNIPIELVLPIVYWLIVGVAVIYIGKVLLNKRKLENVGDRSKNLIPINFIAITVLASVLVMVLSLVDTTVTTHGSLWSVTTIAYLIAVVFLCYYIVLMILTGKIKHSLKVFITPAAVSGVLIAAVVIFMTGGFGYSSYVPDLEKVEYAIIQTSSVYTKLNDNMNNSDYKNDYTLFYSAYYKSGFQVANKDDLKIVSELAKEVAEVTDEMEYNPISITYNLSNGKTVVRSFYTVRCDYPILETKIEKTNAYKANMEYTLTGNYDNPYINEINTAIQKFTEKYGEAFTYFDAQLFKKTYTDCEAHIVCEDGINSFTVKNTDELRESLLKDYLESSVEERFTSHEKIIGAVVFSPNESGELENYDYDDENTYNYNDKYTLYIRESMENTVNYLKSTGEYDKLFTGSNKDLVSVKVIPVGKNISIIEDYSGIGKIFYGINYTKEEIENDILQNDAYEDDGASFTDENGTIKDRLNMFSSAQKYTEPEKMQDIYEKVRVMGAGNSDDFLVLLEYSNGTNALRLLRQEDAEKVLK